MAYLHKLKRSKALLLFIVFIGIMIVFLIGSSRNVFTSKIFMQNQLTELELTGELTSARVIQQDIIIPEGYTQQFVEFNIFFATYQRSNTSQLEISLIQDETEQVVSLDASSLKDNSFKKIRFDDKNFKAGNAILLISPKGATNGNAVTVALTKDASQGTVIVDGTEHKEYGLLHQEIYSGTEWTLLFLFLFTCLYILICFKIMNIKSSTVNYYFLISIMLIIIITIYRFPSLTIWNQPWAEAATNFYMGASNNGWITNLKQLDAGYLPLLTRLITLVVVKVFHAGIYFPIITQSIAVFFIAIFASSISLRYFKGLISSDFLRFIVGLVLGLGLFHDYELYTFINFSYLGVIPCLFIMFLNIEKVGKFKFVVLNIFFFLVLSSKAYFIVFAPFYGVILIYNLMKKNHKSSIFYLTSCISMLMQLIVVITNRSTWTAQSESVDKGILDMAIQGSVLYIKNLYHIFFKLAFFQSSLVTYYTLTICLIVLTVVAIYYSRKLLSKKVIYFIVSTQLLAMMSVVMSLTVPYIKDSAVWNIQFNVPYNRHFIFSNIFVFLGIFIWLINLFESKRKQFIIGVLIVLTYSFSGFNAKDIYEYENYSFSNWQDNYGQFENGGCLAVNPYPWIICNPDTDFYPPLEINDSIGTHEIDVNNLVPGSNTRKVSGLLLDKSNPWNRKIKVIAYDSEGGVIGETIETSDSTDRYGYYKFDKLLNIDHIKFYDENNSEVVLFNPKVIFFGKI